MKEFLPPCTPYYQNFLWSFFLTTPKKITAQSAVTAAVRRAEAEPSTERREILTNFALPIAPFQNSSIKSLERGTGETFSKGFPR